MRALTLNVGNLGFCWVGDLRFDDVPDNGPQSSIMAGIAGSRESLMDALRQALKGNVLLGPPPEPMVTVIDLKGLKTLCEADLDRAKLVEAAG